MILITLVMCVVAILSMLLLLQMIRYALACIGIEEREDYWGVLGRRRSVWRGPTEEQKKAMEDAIEAQLPDIHLTSNQEVTCPVCLDLIYDDEPTKQLQCGHYYHRDCIIAWCHKRIQKEYVHSISCPTCRCLHPLEVPSLSSASTMSDPQMLGRSEGEVSERDLEVNV